MRLAEIHVFSVKALGGESLHAAEVEPCGLAGDRRWMVVDASGRFISQRVAPHMALVHARDVAGGLVLSAPGLDTVEIACPAADGTAEPVVVWRDRVRAVPAPVADAWISAALGQACRLVHMADPAARPCSSSFARPGETVSFADGFPVLLTSLASLAAVNAHLAHPVTIDRFRGNLVVEGADAWAEDCWRVVRIGGAVFRVAKPCDRCTVTTIDQRTGTRPDRMEPLRTLGRLRHDERGIMFGQNLVPLELGRVTVGDAIEVLEAGEPNVVPIGEEIAS